MLGTFSERRDETQKKDKEKSRTEVDREVSWWIADLTTGRGRRVEDFWTRIRTQTRLKNIFRPGSA